MKKKTVPLAASLLEHVDLEAVLHFVRIAEYGSLTQAAESLGLPKSTLSRSLARLEKSLAAKLVHRTTRSLSLTDVGQALYARAEPHLAGLDEAIRSSSCLDRDPSGVLRITISHDMSEAFLPEILPAFAARFPRIRVEVNVTQRVVQLAREGFHVALRPSLNSSEENVIAKKIVDTHLALFASPNYLAAHGTPKNLKALATHQWVLFKNGRMSFEDLIEGMDEKIEAPAEPRICTDDFSLVRSLLKGGAGIGFLPTFIAHADEQKGALVRVLPEVVSNIGALHVVYPHQRNVPAKVTAFRDFLMGYFKTKNF